MNRITKNLHSEFSEIGEQSAIDEHESIYLPAPSVKETVRVYLRVKPKTEEESHYYSIASTIPEDLEDQEQLIDADCKRPPEGEVVSIETDYQVALTAPQDSNAYKISINGNGKLIHRYAFTKVGGVSCSFFGAPLEYGTGACPNFFREIELEKDLFANLIKVEIFSSNRREHGETERSRSSWFLSR